MLCCLAKEFGWTKEYIDNNLTVEQINRYYELIQQQQKEHFFTLAITIQQAAASAFGNLPSDSFRKFIDGFVEIKNNEVNIDKMKLDGLEIEEK